MESSIRGSDGYSLANSIGRINTILSGADTSYEEVDAVPARDKLTFTNGFYVNCSAVWVDLRESSKLTEKYKRPALARLYRAYISELVAVMHLSTRCVEVNIQGDAVWGVFDTPWKVHIDATYSTAVRCRTLIKVLNCRLTKYGYGTIRAGIGIDYGRALMVKAGYSGSSINDLVYMGDVVNTACGLSDHGARTEWTDPIVLSSVVQQNLNEHNRGLCSGPKYVGGYYAYTSSAVTTSMQDWVDEHCA